MPAVWIHVKFRRDVVCEESVVEKEAVLNRHGTVVGGMHKKRGRSIGCNLQLVGVAVHKFFGWILADQIATRAAVGRRG